MGFAEAGVGAGQILSLLGLPALFAAVGLTPAFLALPLAAGTFLDRGLGFGAVWGVATALGLLRFLTVLGIREPGRR